MVACVIAEEVKFNEQTNHSQRSSCAHDRHFGIAAAATPADCQALFQKADINKDGSLQSEEAKVFLEAMDKAQVKPADAAMVKQDEFMAACQKDAFAGIDPATIGSSQNAAATAEQPAARPNNRLQRLRISHPARQRQPSRRQPVNKLLPRQPIRASSLRHNDCDHRGSLGDSGRLHGFGYNGSHSVLSEQ